MPASMPGISSEQPPSSLVVTDQNPNGTTARADRLVHTSANISGSRFTGAIAHGQTASGRADAYGSQAQLVHRTRTVVCGILAQLSLTRAFRYDDARSLFGREPALARCRPLKRGNTAKSKEPIMRIVRPEALALAVLFIAASSPARPAAAQADHPPSCAVRQRPAVIKIVEPPEYPAIAQAESLTGTAIIQVDLSPDGSITGAYVRTSSGSVLLDDAAVKTAKSLVYAPEIRDCTAIAGSYAVEVSFPG